MDGWEGEEATSRSLIYHVYLIFGVQLALTNVLKIKLKKKINKSKGWKKEKRKD